MMDCDSNFLEEIAEVFSSLEMPSTAKRLRDIATKILILDINEEWPDDDDA